MRRIRFFVALILAGVLTACSSTFLYNQLDWLIPWYVDDYVDLTREQNQTFKARLEPVLKWHRSEELVTYLPILDRIEADLDAPVTEEVIVGWTEEFEAAYRRLEERWLPLALQLGEELSDKQVEEFMANLYKEQEKLEKKYLKRSDEDYIDESYDNLVDNLSDVMGRLDREQKAALREAAGQLQRFDQGWLDERRRWLETMGEILQREPGWQEAMRAAIAARETDRSEAYRQAWEFNQSVLLNAVAATINSRTEKQDARIRRELASFREDINTLIADAE